MQLLLISSKSFLATIRERSSPDERQMRGSENVSST
jgi:hypothetical protein